MRTTLKICAAAFALCALMPALAAAQTNPVSLPPVVVSATQVPTPAEQIGSSVTVITSEDIERDQLRSVPDILNNVPGLNVVQSGGPGGQTAVFMRGTGSQHVKVLIDGIDAGDPSAPNGAFDFAHLLASDIERIEILRGPQGGLYGASAIGGVISITTKKGEGAPKATAVIEGGSMSTFNQATSLRGAHNNIDYSFNVTHLRAADVPVTPAYMVAPGGHTNPNLYDNWTYSTRLGAKVSDDVTINFVGRHIDSKLLYTNDDTTVFPFVSYSDRSNYGNRSSFGRTEAVWSALDGRFVNTFGVNVTDYTRDNQDPNGNPPSHYRGTRDAFDWRGKLLVVPGQTLVMGLERENDRASSSGFSTSTSSVQSYNAKSGNQAGFLELQSQFAERFFLVSNVRADDNDQFGEHVTWRVAPAFLVPVTQTKLKASYGTGFKAPTLYELYGVGDFSYVGNPALKPEQSKGYDFGFEQPLANGRFNFGATYFHNDIINLISNVFSPTNTYVNTGHAHMHGVESFAEVRITERLRVRADYTVTIASNADTGEELSRRPRNKVNVSTIWNATDALSLTTTLVYVGTWKDFDRPGNLTVAGDTPGYTVVNLAANYVVTKNITWFGRIDNLFNRYYENPAGWEQPRFAVYSGLKFSN